MVFKGPGGVFPTREPENPELGKLGPSSRNPVQVFLFKFLEHHKLVMLPDHYYGDTVVKSTDI